MSKLAARGIVHKYGNNVDTDVIIPARYLNTSDPKELAEHNMLVDVGKDNFGCGSSREHAPIAIKESGISCVIACTFARIFYRNAINIGLPILECSQAANEIKAGDEVDINFDSGRITDITTGRVYTAEPFPDFIKDIIDKGGLLNSIKK